MRKNIKVSGYYGMNNYGDDLFALLSYKAIRDNFYPDKCNIIGPSLSKPYEDYELALSKINKYYSDLKLRGKVTRSLNYFQSTFQTDYFMFCGGSLYTNPSFSTKDLIYLLNFRRYKLHALGVSVGPFNNIRAENSVKEYLSQYEFIALRDYKSYERVKSFNIDAKIIMAGDLAGLALDYFNKRKNNNKKSKEINIGFSPCLTDSSEISKNYVYNFVSNIRYLKEYFDFEVSIICLNTNLYNGDLALCKLAQDMLEDIDIKSSIVLYDDLGIEETWQTIASLDYFITVRLHGAITAYLTKTPFFLYEYQEKCTEFLRYINYKSDDLETYMSDPSYLCKKIVRDLQSSNDLMDTRIFVDSSRLNITENPLFIES